MSTHAKMMPEEYVNLVLATESPAVPPNMPMRIIHGILGCVTESGELSDQLKRHLYYGQALDDVNIKEELGDLSWYMSLLLDAIGSSWEEIWKMNIDKLRKRYPNKFTVHDAANRDLDTERETLERSQQTQRDCFGEYKQYTDCKICPNRFDCAANIK